MELSQADRDARFARILEELDDVEAKIEELHPASQTRSMVFVLFLVLVVLCIVAAFLTILVVPGAWDLAPFLIAAGAFALVGLKSISSKNEALAELKQERSRLTEGPLD
jgi:hypothetical protein